MGKIFVRKMVVFMIAAAMILSSGACVFATSSSEVGAVKKITSIEQYGNKTVKIVWKKVPNAKAYIIYKNGKKIAKVTKTNYLLKGLKAGEKYTLQIAAVAADGKTIGDKSAIKSNTHSMRWMKNIVVKKAKPGKKQVTIRWKKVKGSTGYMVKYSKDKKTWKTKVVKGSAKTSTVIKKLSKGKWYYTVRPLSKKSGKTYWGVLCPIKTVKVK